MRAGVDEKAEKQLGERFLWLACPTLVHTHKDISIAMILKEETFLFSSIWLAIFLLGGCRSWIIGEHHLEVFRPQLGVKISYNTRIILSVN